MHLVIANGDNDITLQDANLEFFDGARVAGLLLAPMTDSYESISRVRSHGRPVVLLNYDPQPRDNCCVLTDNEHVGYLAARHLIDEGHTRLAFVGRRDQFQPVRLRRLGAHRAVTEEGGRISLEEIPTLDLNPPSGRKVGEELASRPPADVPTASSR